LEKGREAFSSAARHSERELEDRCTSSTSFLKFIVKCNEADDFAQDNSLIG